MIAIVKYNAGNVTSLGNALQRLGAEFVVTDEPELLLSADKVIFPGVGEASSAMQHLRARNLDRVLKELKQPFLGICLGMQLMCSYSEEGQTDCLGIFEAKVRRFPAKGKVPHMGWNNLESSSGPLFKGLPSTTDLYFVHSFFAEICTETTAQCDYLLPFSAALGRDNFHGLQFHPEKSSEAGRIILKNFLEL